MSEINLEILPKDGKRMLKELENGNMVIARSKNEFLYILEYERQFQLFRHMPGAPGGGQKTFPKDEKHTVTVSKIADIADSLYMAEFKKEANIFGVMFTAEEAILSMFPGDDPDSDGIVDFGLVE